MITLKLAFRTVLTIFGCILVGIVSSEDVTQRLARSDGRFMEECFIPDFTCLNVIQPSENDLKQVDTNEIMAVLNGTSQSEYLNIAAPFVQVYLSNIQNIASMGDSISAGVFAKPGATLLSAAFDKWFENRAVSWSNGARKNALTIRNIASIYSPHIKGGSLFTTEVGAAYSYETHAWNFAQSRAKSNDLSTQVDNFLQYFQKQASNDKWTMLNIFIGSNDLCWFCRENINYEHNIRNALRKIEEAGVGKVLVNLVGLLNIRRSDSLATAGCRLLHNLVEICPCMSDVTMAQKQEEFNNALKSISHEYQKKYLESLLARNGKDPHNNSLIVFYQTPFNTFDLSAAGPELISEVDCFHPSICGQQALAFQFFNSLSEPSEATKSQMGALMSHPAHRTQLRWKCPSFDTFIQ
ncbi:hypothetical protein MP638_002509 [Amoeboaphelidium occidentale]|nr:hypothetical protein MP638_002509 [Amoeboaphelidium occidentale]